LTRIVRFFLIFGVGLLALDAALYVFVANRTPDVIGPAVTSSGTAAIGGPFELVDTDGEQVSDQTYRGKWMLIYFGYTFCPDACPTALSNIGIALQALGAEANVIQPLFITVDPKRDTVVTLHSYLQSFDPRIIGLTGSEAQIRAIAKTYRVYVEPQKPEADGNYLVDHSSYLYLMDPNGTFVDVVQSTTPPAQIADSLRTSLKDHTT
jgi:protein SCO1/2